MAVIGFYQALPSFTGFYWVFTGFYRVRSRNGLYLVLLGFTGFFLDNKPVANGSGTVGTARSSGTAGGPRGGRAGPTAWTPGRSMGHETPGRPDRRPSGRPPFHQSLIHFYVIDFISTAKKKKKIFFLSSTEESSSCLGGNKLRNHF